MGLFHHVVVYMGDLHLVHPALNLSILDAGTTSKIDDLLKFAFLGKFPPYDRIVTEGG